MTISETTESSYSKARRILVSARLELMGQLAKFSPDELTQHSIAGEFSPLQLAHYVYIADGFGLEQIKRVRQEDNPLIPNLNEHAPQLMQEVEEPTSLDAVFAGMTARREEIFEYLSSLHETTWSRRYHNAQGEEHSFPELVSMLAIHDQQQAQQLVKLKEAMQ